MSGFKFKIQIQSNPTFHTKDSKRILQFAPSKTQSRCRRCVLAHHRCVINQRLKSLESRIGSSAVVVVILPDPFRGMGRGGTPRRPNSRATPQGLDYRSRIEREEPKIDLRRGSEAGQSRRRWLRTCRGYPQALQAEFSFQLIL